MSPSYLYHGKPSSSSGVTRLRVPSPQPAHAFCHSVRRFVSDKTFPRFGSIAVSIMTRTDGSGTVRASAFLVWPSPGTSIEINLWRVDLQSFADAHAELIKERDERETGRKFTRQHLAAAVGTAMINRSLTCLRPKVRRQQVHQFVELLRFEEPFPCRRFFLQAVTPLTYGRNYRPQVRILPLIFMTTSPMREPVSA